MMRFFIHPLLYWLPAGLPFLRLGETTFDTDFPMCRMDEVRAHQLQGWEGRLALANQERAARAGWLIEGLDLDRRGIKPITGKEAIYLRLPVMVRDRETKEALCRSEPRSRRWTEPKLSGDDSRDSGTGGSVGRPEMRRRSGSCRSLGDITDSPIRHGSRSSENRSDIGKQGEWAGSHEGREPLNCRLLVIMIRLCFLYGRVGTDSR